VVIGGDTEVKSFLVFFFGGDGTQDLMHTSQVRYQRYVPLHSLASPKSFVGFVWFFFCFVLFCF
jgi:hypothetical protein